MRKLASRTTLLCALTFLVSAGFVFADEDALHKAESFYSARKWEESIEQYKIAIKSQTGTDAANSMFRMGLAHRYRGRYQDAIDMLIKSRETGDLPLSDAARTKVEVGYCYYIMREFDKALVALEDAIADTNNSAAGRSDARFYAAYLSNKIEKYDESIAYLKAIAEDEDASEYYRSKAMVLQGTVYRRQKKYSEAREMYRAAIEFTDGKGSNAVRAQSSLEELDTILSGDDPFYIKPYICHVSNDQAKVYWVSKGKFEGAHVVIHNTLKPGNESKVMPILLDIAEGGFVHYEAQVAGLEHSNEVKYTVHCGEKEISGHFYSQLDVERPYKFSVLGDTQTMAPVHTKVGLQIAKHEPEFVIHCGDHVESGSKWFEWKSQLFGPGEPYMPFTNFWPARGNHDGGPYYPRLFSLMKRQYFSFDYGNMRVIVIDSFGPGMGGDRRKEQVKWFEEQLKSNDKLWTVVAVHDPMMTTDSLNHWFGENDFLPLVQEYEVDFVFSGHHHMYRRYMPVGLPGKNPTYHITTGGAGGSLGGNHPSPILHKGQLIHHHLNFTVDGNHLKMEAVTLDGEPLDSLELIKTNGRYQSEVLEQAVDFKTARSLASLLFEFTIPRLDHHTLVNFATTPEAGKEVTMYYDMSRLPKGNIDPARFPEGTNLVIDQMPGNPWKVTKQVVSIASGRVEFKVTAPDNMIIKDGNVYPVMKYMMGAKLAGREYNAYDFTAQTNLPEK